MDYNTTTKDNLVRDIIELIDIPDGDILIPHDKIRDFVYGNYDKTLYEALSTLSELYAEFTEPKELTISQLKKMIKHCKNPLEKKQLERKLNELYKERKKENKL